jgi:hypothetical protein
MSFNLTSKFIGSQTLLKESVVTTNAQEPSSWMDNFSIDSVSALPVLAYWSRVIGITGTVAHLNSDWRVEADCSTAANDEAGITSKVIPLVAAGVVSGYTSMKTKVRLGVMAQAPADALCKIGFANAAGDRRAWLENTAANTFRLVCQDGLGTTNGTPFILDLATNAVELEFRLYVLAGSIDKAEVWASGVLMSTILTNVPDVSNILMRFYVKKINAAAGGDINLLVYFVKTFPVNLG